MQKINRKVTGMKIVNDFPPNYEAIKKAFNPPKEIVFTYGDTIYAPYLQEELIPMNVIRHEETHAKQQIDPSSWWTRYLIDAQFRLEQELEAYQMQYKYFCKHNKFKKERAKFLLSIAKDLSSPTYGSIMNIEEAKERIKNESN